jgi:hypothetical protein
MSENEIVGLGKNCMTKDNTRIGVVRMGKNQPYFHIERVLLTGRTDDRFSISRQGRPVQGQVS